MAPPGVSTGVTVSGGAGAAGVIAWVTAAWSRWAKSSGLGRGIVGSAAAMRTAMAYVRAARESVTRWPDLRRHQAVRGLLHQGEPFAGAIEQGSSDPTP